MKGASAEVAIWSFFSRQGLYFHHTKNQPPLRPPSTFSEHWPWFWQYLLSEKFTKKIWYKILIITISKSAKFFAWEAYWKRNKSLLLTFFFNPQKPYRPSCPIVQCATLDQHLPEPATKGLFLSSCCQGKGTSATPPFSGCRQVRTWLVSFSSYLSGELLLGPHAKQPKVGEPLVYGVPQHTWYWVVYFFPAGVLFSTENAIKTAFSKVYSGNINTKYAKKKHQIHKKHQILKKTLTMQKKQKEHQILKKTPTTPKKQQIYKKNHQILQNTPNFHLRCFVAKKFSKFTHFLV